MGMETIIIGNGPAGYFTATKLAELDPAGKITILEREKEPFYAKIRLSDYVAGKLEREKLYLGTAEALEKKGIRLVQGKDIDSLDTGRKALKADGAEWTYDRLVLATGSKAFIPPVNGTGAADIQTLRRLSDADRLRDCCASKTSALVMGGGLLGLEAAWALKERGVQVTVVEFFPRLLPRQLNEEQAARVQVLLEKAGLRFILGRTVASVDKKGTGYEAVLDNGECLEAGFVLASAGVRPEVNLAKDAGIEVNKGIVVNERFETSAPGVYAVGDCAESEGKLFGLWIAATTQANGLAKILAGKADRFENLNYEPILKIPGIDMKAILGN